MDPAGGTGLWIRQVARAVDPAGGTGLWIRFRTPPLQKLRKHAACQDGFWILDLDLHPERPNFRGDKQRHRGRRSWIWIWIWGAEA